MFAHPTPLKPDTNHVLVSDIDKDYHALIRQFHLDIGGCKTEVRKVVEVRAYSAGTGESFVEGFSAPLRVRRASSSFGEPLASALSAGLD
jgi:hypothetical protein